MPDVKITDEQRAILRELGKKARRETALRFGEGDVKKGEKILARLAREGGKGGGRPKNRCAKSPEKSKRHRYKEGICTFCGSPKP